MALSGLRVCIIKLLLLYNSSYIENTIQLILIILGGKVSILEGNLKKMNYNAYWKECTEIVKKCWGKCTSEEELILLFIKNTSKLRELKCKTAIGIDNSLMQFSIQK